MSIFQDQVSLMQRARQQLHEKAVNPYAVGMAAAMKATGDKPPLEKSTITKAHKIAKKVEKAGYEPDGNQLDEEIINHLIENGFVETEENAINMIHHMSEEWKESILNERNDEGPQPSIKQLDREESARRAQSGSTPETLEQRVKRRAAEQRARGYGRGRRRY